MAAERQHDSAPSLDRVVGLPLLTLYGVGNLVGGGFYALLGKVSGLAGTFAPISFLIAAVIALFSALAFCELSARYPLGAGPASYVDAVFHRRPLTLFIGANMLLTGLVSAAMLASAIDGFVQDMVPHAPWIGFLIIVGTLTAVAVWGISESVSLAVVITLIEAGGLIYVAVVAGDHVLSTPASIPPLVPRSFDPSPGILLGAFLCFYAYVGFEDLVTLAEEVKRPRKTLPRAILLSLGITTVMYLVVATLANIVVPTEELARSRTPLATVVEKVSEGSGARLGYVSVLAGINGALVQIIMGSRVVYRLAADAKLDALAAIHPRTRTPVRATLLIGASTLALCMVLSVVSLARVTSVLLLLTFAVVNATLWVLKRRGEPAPEDTPCYPAFVPLLGGLLCVAFLALEVARQWGWS